MINPSSEAGHGIGWVWLVVLVSILYLAATFLAVSGA